MEIVMNHFNPSLRFDDLLFKTFSNYFFTFVRFNLLPKRTIFLSLRSSPLTKERIDFKLPDLIYTIFGRNGSI